MTATGGASSRRKGATTENAVVKYLAKNGYPEAERRPAGTTGVDVIGVGSMAVEVKGAERLELSAWLDQAVRQGKKNGRIPVVIAKRRGRTDVGEWYAIMRVSDAVPLFTRARTLDA